MKKVALAVMAAVMALAAFAPGVLAYSPEQNQLLAQVRAATVQYHDVQVALDDGFINTGACVEVPGVGAMGVHFIHMARIMDPSLDPLEPEILLYQPLPNGDYRLVGVEYMLAIGGPDSPIPNPAPPAPSLFGVTFNGPMLPHYDLHVWAWQANPVVTFAQFNPTFSCR